MFIFCLFFFFIIAHQNRKYFSSSVNEGLLGAPAPWINTLGIRLITPAYSKVINTTLSSLPPSVLSVFALCHGFVLHFPSFSIKHVAADHHHSMTHWQSVQIKAGTVRGAPHPAPTVTFFKWVSHFRLKSKKNPKTFSQLNVKCILFCT